jgi:uncharacterized protein YdcH (DUF465 family)
VQGGRSLTVEIGGRDRFKFFKRPVVPTLEGGTQTASAPLALASNRPTIHRALQPRSQLLQTDAKGSIIAPSKPRTLLDPVPKRPGSHGRKADSFGALTLTGDAAADSGTREMGCQTLYRENDCQTDPYTPDYYVEEGHEPEVLALMELRYAEGLPAGMGEVEMIDRVQRRKAVESSLPQGNDPQSMNARLHALETLEKTEWEEREAHIRGLQEGRLEQIDAALHRREARREEASRQRVEELKKQKLAEVEGKLQRMQEKRLTATRKLSSKHANPCAEKPDRDIIAAHSTHGPRGAAVPSNALVERINTTNYDVRPTLLSFPEGVEELERTKLDKLETVKESKLQPPQDKATSLLTTNFQKRKARQVNEHLEYADQVIQASKVEKQKQQSVQDLYRATPRLQRPDTPTLVLAGDAEEEREEAMLLLQRLLRGRAVQNDFFEGKERCHGLIEELQAASNAKGHEEWWRPDKEREVFQAKQAAAVQAVVDEAQSDIVFGTLDHLRKELLRQQEAAKVDRLRQTAERTRAERERAEREKRERERAVRAREEFQYAAITRSTDATVETYLDQLLTSTIRNTATTQAVNEQLVQRPPPPLETAQEQEEYVCGLLDGFVLPMVCHRVDKNQKEHERRKALAETATFAVGAATHR